jgi:glutathionyl-hydroquinone reductase
MQSQFSPSFLLTEPSLQASSTTKDSGITSWASKDGEFRRQPSQFRNFISSQPGSRFAPESGRYHLYVSYACPWAHRTLIVRALKGLQSHISVTAVHWHMAERGWRFVTRDEQALSEADWAKTIGGDREWVTPDPLPGHEKFTHLRDVYFGVEPGYEGRFTVPTL